MVNINYLKRVCAVFLVALSLINFIPTPIHAKTTGEKNAKVKDEKTIVVSMGDSFSSGEGIEPFYDQDKKTAQEKVDSDDWLAHRSEKSWPGMLKVSSLDGTLADYKDKGNWYFVASSGAVTADIMGFPNESGEIVGQKKEYNIIDGSTMFRHLSPQIDIFNHIDSDEVDYITLTLGGNDAGFSNIIITAAKNGIPLLEVGNLNTLLQTTIARTDDICNSLFDVYKNIAEAAPNAKIIVADYPKLIDPRDGSQVLFSKDDAVAINNAVQLFSEKIKETVERCSSEEGKSIYFVSVIKEFEGHESYRNLGIDYINGIYTQPKDQDLIQKFMEASAYSMHPNKNGAKAYARCVQAKIDELEGLSDVTCASELGISVFEINGKLYDNYKIKIIGKENGALWGLINKDYNKTIHITSASVQYITLPEGQYEITVTDGDISYSKNVKIKKDALQNMLRFETDFGYKYEYEDDNAETTFTPEITVIPETTITPETALPPETTQLPETTEHVHYYTSTDNTASCTQEVQVIHTCSCGYSYTEIFPIIEHNFVNNICSMCGLQTIKASEGLFFTLNEDQVSYSVLNIGFCKDTEIIIPSEYNGLPVTMVLRDAFENNTKIKSIVFPETMISINSWSFKGCSSLEKVVFNENLIEIQEYAFHSCTNLNDISFPKNIQNIGDGAFYGCTKLSNIEFNENIPIISSNTFQLTSITFTKFGNGEYLGFDNNPYYILMKLNSSHEEKLHEDTKVISKNSIETNNILLTFIIPKNIQKIFYNRLTNIIGRVEITYAGTVDEWNNIIKEDDWDHRCDYYIVHCSDGDVIHQRILN